MTVKTIEITKTNTADILLQKREIYSLEGDQRGLQIISLDGSVWITQQGDHQDYILEPGESFIVSRRGRVLIQAFTPVSLSFTPGKLLPIDRVTSTLRNSQN